MRYHLVLSAIGLLVATVTAQASGTTAAPPAPPAPSTSAAPQQPPPAEPAPSSSVQSAPPPPPPPPPASSQSGVPTITAPRPTTTSTAAPASPSTPSTTSRAAGGGGASSSSSASVNPTDAAGPPDVHLKIPNISVGRIELDVDNVRAEVNLAAEVAKLVTLNAGIQVGVEKVNITIAGVHAQLELIIRLGHLVDIVNRTLQSLDLNPLLINLLDTVTDVVENVVGAVDGLLGSVIQGGTRLNFIIDNLGNIVQQVVTEAGEILSSIVGNFQTNMTYTGQSRDLGNGLTEKQYEYSPLGALVNIIVNGLNQVVQATVVKSGNQPGQGTATTAAPAQPAQPTQAPAGGSARAAGGGRVGRG